MTLDLSLYDSLNDKKSAREAQRARLQTGGGSGGGNEPPHESGLEQRVRLLEGFFSAIDKTLAIMTEQLKHVASREDVSALRMEIAIVSGKLEAKASATELAELKGRVARIPTVPVLVSILLFISLLFAAGSWTVRHLPESWSRALQ